MNTFRKLFAASPRDIKQDVIITPFLNLDYFRINNKGKINKGFLFEVLNEDYFSVIKTGVGASFVGDVVMYLKETNARRVYFIGSCGAVSNFNTGELVLVDKALSLEGFSSVLRQEINFPFINTQNNLHRKFLQLNNNISGVSLASVGSLSLQKNILPLLKKYGVDAVDMEVCAFISAAGFLKFPSLVLLYVTDDIKFKLFCRDLTKKERTVIRQARQKAIYLICDFIRKQNS